MVAESWSAMETKNIDVSFIKLGNDYINSMNIERFIIIEGDIYLSTVAGKERTLHEKTPDDNFTPDSLVRKINEKSHEIISIQEFIDGVYDDGEDNLLYRKWRKKDE